MQTDRPARPGHEEAHEDSRLPLPKLPRNRKGKQVIALFVSDIHLSESAPVCRAEKNNWFDVQAAYLKQLSDLQQQYDVPVFVAGDLFDRWNSTANLINFALYHLPDNIYAIPGNHDLPNHLYREIDRSAYWTLVAAGKIKTLTPGPEGNTCAIESLLVSPFPCGFKVAAPQDSHGLAWNVALVHEYIWTEKSGHPGAPEELRYGKWMKKLKNYDVAIFGDNHKGWMIVKEGKCTVVNCGTFIRRKADEIDYSPSIWCMMSDKSVQRHKLDVSKDEFSNLGKEILELEKSLSIDLSGFIEEVAEKRMSGLGWADTVMIWAKKQKLSESVTKIIIRVVDRATGRES